MKLDKKRQTRENCLYFANSENVKIHEMNFALKLHSKIK